MRPRVTCPYSLGQGSRASSLAHSNPPSNSRKLGTTLALAPFVGRASLLGGPRGQGQAQDRRGHWPSSPSARMESESRAGGPAHLQVLEVGQGLAVGELRLRVALAELVADAAHVAHHGHQEVHTCGKKKMTRGQVTWPGCHGWDGSPGGWGQGWGLTVCGVGAVGL